MADDPSAPQLWRNPWGSRLPVEPVGESWAVHHPGTGLTHLLNPLGMAILQELARQPADLDGLLARLELEEERERLIPVLTSVLDHLDTEGLIVPAGLETPCAGLI